MINSRFENMWIDIEHIWIMHGNLLEIIMKSKDNIDTNVKRFLEEMVRMDVLDKKQKILIIENMAGRDVNFRTGGCYFVCKNTLYADLMTEVMEHLMNFQCDESDNQNSEGWKDIQKRFHSAKLNYIKAYQMYYRG